MLRLLVCLCLLNNAHSYCMVQPVDGHVSAAALSAELGSSTIIGTTSTTAADYENSGFFKCDTLQSIEIPASVNEIGYGAFYMATALASVTIPDSVQSIGSFAFHSTALTSVVIPDSIDSSNKLGQQAFAYSDLLTLPDLSFSPPHHYGVFAFTPYYKCNLDTSPPGMDITTGHGTYTGESFRFCKRLTSVTISNDAKEIQLYAFEGCTALQTVNFSLATQLTTIRQEAFKDSGVTSVTFPESLEVLEGNAFKGCTALQSIDFSLATKLNEISYGVFQDSGVTSVTFPDSLIKIYGSAFRNTALASVTFPDSLISIYDSAFRNTALASVTFPESLQEIGEKAFFGCQNLISVNIRNDATIIGPSAFPPGLFILDLFKREGTSVETILSSFTADELKTAYQLKGDCPQ